MWGMREWGVEKDFQARLDTWKIDDATYWERGQNENRKMTCSLWDIMNFVRLWDIQVEMSDEWISEFGVQQWSALLYRDCQVLGLRKSFTCFCVIKFLMTLANDVSYYLSRWRNSASRKIISLVFVRSHSRKMKSIHRSVGLIRQEVRHEQ